MTLSEPKMDGVVVPVLGKVAAGAPTLAEEHVEDYLTVPTSFAPGNDLFALKVQGDSMVGAGILDGDVVVVQSRSDAASGDIVVALLPGPAEPEATVKRLKRERNRVMLVPENPRFEPFEMDPEGRILGTVVTVLRRL
jgi:repressor LexA